MRGEVMDDLISREDALKALDEMSYKSPHESATSVVRKKHFGEILEKFIMQQPSAQQWIPCSERLPHDERKAYWICLDTGGQGECRWTNNRYGLGESDTWGWSAMDIPMYTKVVAWMPLPEPYKGEENADI